MTCSRDGAAILLVERHRDHDLERVRIVFICGHDEWQTMAEPSFELTVPGMRRCATCGELFEKHTRCARKCAGCRICIDCAHEPARRHTIATCPRRRAALAVA